MEKTDILNLEDYIMPTDAFIKTMHVVRESYSLLPEKDHIGTYINYSDLLEMRSEFIRELKNTITTYVYSKQKQIRLVEQFKFEGRDDAGAWQNLQERARAKFRPMCLKGQFSELLLCNLLQHYFRAAPLLRKMSITTNPNIERFGADAIHIGQEEGLYKLYIGEAKTYNRKKGGLVSALVDAIEDVIKHYQNHRKELDLYTYEDFLPEELENKARAYQMGELQLEVNLVCIITYDCKEEVKGSTRDEILDCVVQNLRDATLKAKNHKIFSNVPEPLMPRLNYILFPVRDMDNLIAAFQERLAS